MKKFITGIVLLILLVPVLAACGTATAPATQSATGVNIKLETNPDQAMMGDVELVLTITDQNSNPIEGAVVDVSADHTDMTGMNMGGPATGQGNGKYVIKANFSMSGNWLITVYVRKGELDEKQDIPLEVK